MTSDVPQNPLAPAARGRRPAWLDTVRQVVTGVLALTLLTLAGLVWFGFPRAVTRSLLARLNAGAMFCEVEGVALDMRGGLTARGVRIYRKGVVGPPFLEAREARILFRFFRWPRARGGAVKEIVVRGGVVRPFFLAPEVAGRGGGGMPAGAWFAIPEPRDLAVSIEDSDVLGVWVERANAQLRLNPAGGTVSGLSATIGQDRQRGDVRGTVGWNESRHVHGSLVTSFDPHVLMAPCRAFQVENVSRVLEWFSFPSDSPNCDVTFDWSVDRLTAKGRFQASNFAYRGAGVGFANVMAAFEYGPDAQRMALNPLVLVIGGRNVSGKVSVDFGQGQAVVEVVSTADIPTVGRIAGITEGSFLDAWHFGHGTRVYAKGVVGYDHPAVSDLEAVVEGPGIGIGRLAADECYFRFLMKGTTNLLSDIRGKLGGGSFTGSAVLTPATDGSDETCYRIRGEMIHVDLQRMMALWDTAVATQAEGKVYGSIELSGVAGTGHGATARGQGHLDVRRGRLFRIPLFGGMTEALARALPGVDLALKPTEARMPFEVRDGKVYSDDVQIDGDVLSLTARGSGTLDGQLEFDVQVRPMTDKSVIGQAMRVLTYPLSRLFEFRLDGRLDKPRWRPFSLIREGAGQAEAKRLGTR